jgi:hypothetical protein
MLKCEDCELRMAEFDFGEEIEAHLRICGDCRGLAEELRQDTIALAAMREEELPWEERLEFPHFAQLGWARWWHRLQPVRARISSRADGGFSRHWAAVTTAAALALIAIALPWHRKAAVVAPPSVPVVAAALAPAPEIVAVAPIRKPRRNVARPEPPQPEETLMVKMLTPDPDIVIYWIVEPKEKSE